MHSVAHPARRLTSLLACTLLASASVCAVPPQGNDAALEWSSFLGGDQGESHLRVARDAAGRVYVAGQTSSTDFPVTPGAFDTTYNGSDDVFVCQIDPTGSTILWATYLGGWSIESVGAIAVGPGGDVYVCGWARRDFPVTAGAFDTTPGGEQDAWLARLSSSGSTLIYATYLGGLLDDVALGLTVGENGDAYVVGYTRSSDYPSTPGAFDPTFNGPLDITDGFVTRVDATGSALVYSTFLGGTGYDSATAIALDELGNAYVTGGAYSKDFPTTPGAFDRATEGEDAFVTKIDPTGSQLIFSTMLGSTSFAESGSAILVDADHRTWVAGNTSSAVFPVTPDAFAPNPPGVDDGFVSVFDSTGSILLHSTYFGGSGFEWLKGLARLANGDVLLSGRTFSGDFPTTPGAYDPFLNGGDAFIAVLDSRLSTLRYSTFLGGLSQEYSPRGVVMPDDSVVVVGYTRSTDYPVTPGVFDPVYSNWSLGWDEGFVTRLRAGPVLSLVGVPAGGHSIAFEIERAPSSQTGHLAQVLLSCSGTAGIRLPNPGPPLMLPLTFDGCTSLSIQLASALQTPIDTSGHGGTPAYLLPAGLPVGATFWAAAFLVDPVSVRFQFVTPPIGITTQ